MLLRFREPLVCDIFDNDSVIFSPDCRFLAVLASNASITIKNALTFEDVTLIECPGPINSFSWSPDSKLLLVVMKNLNSLQIYFVEKTRTNHNHLTQSFAGISAGKIDTERTMWSPDSKFVIIFGTLACQMFAWDINSNAVRKLAPPKNTESSLAYSPDGTTIAEISREPGKDTLILFDAQTFRRKTTINLGTLDAKTVKWSPDGSIIIVIDSLCRHLLQIINVKTQTIIGHSAYDGYLGVTDASACQNSKIIAVGGFDDYVRLLITPEWHPLAEFLHETTIKTPSVTIFTEQGGKLVQSEPPVDLSQSGTSGITNVKWAIGSRLLATTSAKTPSAVFIWNAETVSLSHLLVFVSPVIQLEWSPVEEVLAVSTGSDFIQTWSPTSVTSARTPQSMRVHTFAWRSDGQEILAVDKSAGTFSVACRT